MIALITLSIDVLSLLDSGFFYCDEEILGEIKSLEAEVCNF